MDGQLPLPVITPSHITHHNIQRTNRGQTPAMLARSLGHAAVAEALEVSVVTLHFGLVHIDGYLGA